MHGHLVRVKAWGQCPGGEKSKLHLKVKVSQVQKDGEAVWLQAETMEGKTQVREGIMQVR